MKNRFGWRDRQDVVITPSGADKDPEDMDDDELMGEVNRALKVVEHARKSGAKKSSSSSKGSKNKTAKKATKKKANKKSKKKSS
jgi:topoisomerase IA-like protein